MNRDRSPTDMLDSILKRKPTTEERPLSEEAYVASLKERFALFHVEHVFEPGDLVKVKPGMRNSKVGLQGRPLIVMDVLTTPVPTGAPTNSLYHHERLDLYVAEIDKDGDYIVWLVDSRRFEPYTE